MISPVVTEQPSEWHLARFTEFASAKVLLGEPMSHGRIVLHLSRDVGREETAWRLGLYLNCWSVLGAEVIWTEWPFQRVQKEPAAFQSWLETNFRGIHTRKERRCVRTAGKFGAAAASYREWMASEIPRLTREAAGTSPSDYDAWWESLSRVRYFGRYIVANGLDAFRIGSFMNAELYELGTIGNHQSPMRGLALLRQEDAGRLLGGEGAKWLNSLGTETRQEVLRRGRREGEGEWLSWFAFAALLCEYRQYYEWAAEYAGNSHDEELSYLLSGYGTYWKKRGFTSRIPQTRSEIFPPECLGEVQGWDGIRIDVAERLKDEGVVWNDLVHDYRATISTGRLVYRPTRETPPSAEARR